MGQEKLNQSIQEHHFEYYEDLYDKGLFLRVLQHVEQHHGPYRQLADLRLRMKVARCLRHLGLDRDSDAVILRTWRTHRNDPDIVLDYLDVIKRRRSPLAALNTSRCLLSLEGICRKDQAYILCNQVDIACSFRDFSMAETLLEQARAYCTDRWVDLQTVYLYLAEDKYQEALDHTLMFTKTHTSYRPAIQLLAHLYHLSGHLQRAIDVLKPYCEQMQSYSLSMQFFNYCVEAKQFADARQCLFHLTSILFDKPKYLQKELNRANADLLCAQQRYDEALPFLEQKNFFQRTVSEAIRSAPDQSQRQVLDVPFIRQHHMTCAPASLSAVSTYWGKIISQAEVVDAICYDGTPAVDERRWVQQQGWHVIEFDMQFEAVKSLVDRGIPILLSTVEPGSAHLQVVVGYDQLMKTYLMRDPYYPRLQEMLIDAAQQYYASTGPRCMIMLPDNKLDLLQGIVLEASDLYDHYFELKSAADQHHRSDAYAALRVMIAMNPEHRLTLYAHRDLAIYDQDERKVLQYTELLLERYPDDVNLQLSKVNSLTAIGPSGEYLEYMEQLSHQANCHFLIKSRLADNLRFDHRQKRRVDKLLRSLLRRDSFHAPTLYAYAGVLWDRGKYSDSYEIYRFVTCLEDKNERYAISYFKAARYHKQSEAGLDFLVDRYHRFAKNSSGPAISLFNACDAIAKTKDGLHYLECAIELRPQDGELMLFTAQQYLDAGKLERCIELAERAKTLTNMIRYYELSAAVCERQQNRKEAIQCWEKVLAYEPLNARANSSMIGLLLDEGERNTACEFIDTQIGKFPGNYNLLCARVRTLDGSDYRERVDAYQSIIDSHPDDIWAYLGVAAELIAQGELNRALRYSDEAIRVNSNDAAAFTQLGDVYAAKQCIEEAKNAYRRAIELSCDHIEAFEPLLQCALDYDSERSELAFIYDQLIKQVSYGDGILQYQFLAKRWLAVQEINGFLQQALDERPDLWQSWLALSNSYRDQGLLDKAYKTLDSAIERFPLIPNLLYEKAELLRLMNRLDDAEVLLFEAVNLSPGWAKAANKLADVLEMQGKFDAAIDSLRMVIYRSQMQASPHAYLASLLWRIDQKGQAIEEMQKALQLDPFYEWAWEELKKWCDQLGMTQRVQELINSARKKMPNHWQLLRIHARLLDDPVTARDLQADYLKIHPQSVELSTDHVHTLVELGDFDTALSICDQSRWRGDRPIEIKAARAWALERRGDIDQAIEEMHCVVTQHTNYYDGWRLLTIWYDTKNNSSKVIECVEQCRRLYPNDSSVLCFVAEKLQHHDKTQSQCVSKLLKRAYFLDPTDSYNGLTYFDHLIANEQYSDAKSIVQRLKRHVDNVYVHYRQLQIAHWESDAKTVLDLWKTIIQDSEVNDYLIGHSWEYIEQLESQPQAVSDIEQLQANAVPVSPYVGQYLAYYYFGEYGQKTFEEKLINNGQKDALYSRMLEGYLRTLIDQKGRVSSKREAVLLEHCNKDTTNWGLVGYLYADHGHWHSVVKWMNDYADRRDSEAWMLYFYSIGLRQTGHWDQAVKVMGEAYALEADQYREDIVIWHSLDNLLVGVSADFDALQLIEAADIAGLSSYPLSIIKVFFTLGKRSFDEAYHDISPLLRQCQREFQGVRGSSAAEAAKRLFHECLAARIQMPFLQRMLWRWRLSNHF